MNPAATPLVEHFHHAPTGTITYLVRDPAGRAAAIIDPVLDYDPAAARTSTVSVDAVLARVRGQQLDVQWILETHAHADHLSAAGYLHDVLGRRSGCRGIIAVQRHFSEMFGWARPSRPTAAISIACSTMATASPSAACRCRCWPRPVTPWTA